MFSGKVASTRKGWFFCYELPSKRADGSWTEPGDGLYRWYAIDPTLENICDSNYECWKAILCNENEPRVLPCREEELTNARKAMDAYLKKNYMRQVQAPIGVKPRLITWMQLY